MNVKTYIIVFYNPNVSVENINRWILYSPYVLSYWNYLPLVYCIKSYSLVDELRVHFEPILGMHNFIIAEINSENISGRLPAEAWPWFRQTHFPPKPPIPGAQVTPPAGTFLERLGDPFKK